jgi:hypothetical protein
MDFDDVITRVPHVAPCRRAVGANARVAAVVLVKVIADISFVRCVLVAVVRARVNDPSEARAPLIHHHGAGGYAHATRARDARTQHESSYAYNYNTTPLRPTSRESRAF